MMAFVMAFGVRLSELRYRGFLHIAVGTHLNGLKRMLPVAWIDNVDRRLQLQRSGVAGVWVYERSASFGVLSDGQPSFRLIVPTLRPRRLTENRCHLELGCWICMHAARRMSNCEALPDDMGKACGCFPKISAITPRWYTSR